MAVDLNIVEQVRLREPTAQELKGIVAKGTEAAEAKRLAKDKPALQALVAQHDRLLDILGGINYDRVPTIAELEVYFPGKGAQKFFEFGGNPATLRSFLLRHPELAKQLKVSRANTTSNVPPSSPDLLAALVARLKGTALGDSLAVYAQTSETNAALETLLAALTPADRVTTPYVNTLPVSQQASYPATPEYQALEAELESAVRWNATMMVHRAGKNNPGLGGHIGTFASESTIWRVLTMHHARGNGGNGPRDYVFYHGHASPGVYAHMYLEGRVPRKFMEKFRMETKGGPASYPHPHRMPDVWEFPTVSMGYTALGSIYQARFNKYLENRGLAADTGNIYAFLGDGEMDEVESRGALHIAARDGLDKVIFLVNANLQRLDGPVRPNGHIVQELEGSFAGAGWNVIKVLWGSKWDALFAKDTKGILQQRLLEVPDGDWQTYAVAGEIEKGKSRGAYIRQHLFNTPELQALVAGYSDEQIAALTDDRGGHDAAKVHAALEAAKNFHNGKPTAIIFQTIKGHGTPSSGAMSVHQKKGFDHDELKWIRDFEHISPKVISDEAIDNGYPFFEVDGTSPLMHYSRARREALNGFVPARSEVVKSPVTIPGDDFLLTTTAKGTSLSPTVEGYVPEMLALLGGAAKARGQGPASTTTAFISMLRQMLDTDREKFGSRLVPIFPDEARTFGADKQLFGKHRVFDVDGIQYTPADASQMTGYKTAKDGQIAEEGISEAGATAMFTAAATSYATHGVPMIPFYTFYSMFGPQRTLDQWWLNADAHGRGFFIGATAGRTTLNGEGLQHADGHSPLLAHAVPNVQVYDPTFAFEQAIIIQDGLRRMYGDVPENIYYYMTVYNEDYLQSPMPGFAENDTERMEAVKEGVLKGLYQYATADEVYPDQSQQSAYRIEILASGPLMAEALKAQQYLAEHFGVGANVWSATSYSQLAREALEVEDYNLKHPGEKRTSYVQDQLGNKSVVAVSDYVKEVPGLIAKWVPDMTVLGTNGFGKSDTRLNLRNEFQIDSRWIVLAALNRLLIQKRIKLSEVKAYMAEVGIDPNKPNPATETPGPILKNPVALAQATVAAYEDTAVEAEEPVEVPAVVEAPVDTVTPVVAPVATPAVSLTSSSFGERFDRLDASQRELLLKTAYILGGAATKPAGSLSFTLEDESIELLKGKAKIKDTLADQLAKLSYENSEVMSQFLKANPELVQFILTVLSEEENSALREQIGGPVFDLSLVQQTIDALFGETDPDDSDPQGSRGVVTEPADIATDPVNVAADVGNKGTTTVQARAVTNNVSHFPVVAPSLFADAVTITEADVVAADEVEEDVEEADETSVVYPANGNAGYVPGAVAISMGAMQLFTGSAANFGAYLAPAAAM